jgi:hypothetical protein
MHPELARDAESNSTIQVPEIWATLLPVRLPAGAAKKPADEATTTHTGLMGLALQRERKQTLEKR